MIDRLQTFRIFCNHGDQGVGSWSIFGHYIVLKLCDPSCSSVNTNEWNFANAGSSEAYFLTLEWLAFPPASEVFAPVWFFVPWILYSQMPQYLTRLTPRTLHLCPIYDEYARASGAWWLLDKPPCHNSPPGPGVFVAITNCESNFVLEPKEVTDCLWWVLGSAW